MGSGELAFGGGPMFSLPMGFLYSNDVVIVNELFGVTFLGFSPLFGESLGCE